MHPHDPVFMPTVPIKATMLSSQENCGLLIDSLLIDLPAFILHPINRLCYWKHKLNHDNLFLNIIKILTF